MKSLQELLATPEDEKRILEGSCMFDCTLREWTAQRKFIIETIDHSGTLLDIGCANGLLLRSLMEWGNHELVPYGVDPSQERLAGVAEVLPKFKDNFVRAGMTDLEQLPSFRLPAKFDMVYWSVWDGFDLSSYQDYVDSSFWFCETWWTFNPGLLPFRECRQ
jgi:SAM-dependent methyltransferase